MTFYYAVEDALSASVAKRILSHVFGTELSMSSLGPQRGNQPLRAKIRNYSELAVRYPVIVLTDLDSTVCPPRLVQAWFGRTEIPSKLVFRVAVREIEAWVMADRHAFARFLGISPDLIVRNPETLADPKSELISVARGAKRKVREMIVPESGSRAAIGREYNEALCEFVDNHWDPDAASNSAPSLSRALDRLRQVNYG